jgi:CMP-N,N'-diacetyllegionaminic acid synthase
MSTVAVVLARGGSQGIPGKNLKDFCGKPLVAWTVAHACEAAHIDSVWISSDDPDILAVGQDFGAQVIERPADISNSAAPSESGWLHALDTLEKQGVDVTRMVAPQCTSPVRTSADFNGALELFDAEGLDSLFSATAIPDFNIWRPQPDGSLDSYTYDYRRRERRQEKGEQFLENGSFWIFKPDILRNTGNRMGGKIGLWRMEFWKSFQIDEPEDLRFCEVLMRAYLPEDIHEPS